MSNTSNVGVALNAVPASAPDNTLSQIAVSLIILGVIVSIARLVRVKFRRSKLLDDGTARSMADYEAALLPDNDDAAPGTVSQAVPAINA